MWWHYIVDVLLPIIGTVSFAWACIKQIKAVVIGAAVLTVMAYAWWYGPGSSLLAPALAPPVPVASTPPAPIPAMPPIQRPAPVAEAARPGSPACVERPPIRNTFYLCSGAVPNPTEITPGTVSAEKFLQWYAKTHPQWADLAKPSQESRPIGMPFDAQTPEAPTLCDVPPPQGRKFFYCDDYGRQHFMTPVPHMASSDDFLVWYEKAYPQYAAQVRAWRAGTLH